MEDYCKKIINLFGSSSVCRFILESTSTVWLQFYLKSCPPDMKLFWQVMCMGEGHTHIRAYTTTFLRWKTEREGERKRLWPATIWSKLFFVRCICQLRVEGWMSERKREKKKEREREREREGKIVQERMCEDSNERKTQSLNGQLAVARIDACGVSKNATPSCLLAWVSARIAHSYCVRSSPLTFFLSLSLSQTSHTNLASHSRNERRGGESMRQQRPLL